MVVNVFLKRVGAWSTVISVETRVRALAARGESLSAVCSTVGESALFPGVCVFKNDVSRTKMFQQFFASVVPAAQPVLSPLPASKRRPLAPCTHSAFVTSVPFRDMSGGKSTTRMLPQEQRANVFGNNTFRCTSPGCQRFHLGMCQVCPPTTMLKKVGFAWTNPLGSHGGLDLERAMETHVAGCKKAGRNDGKGLPHNFWEAVSELDKKDTLNPDTDKEALEKISKLIHRFEFWKEAYREALGGTNTDATTLLAKRRFQTADSVIAKIRSDGTCAQFVETSNRLHRKRRRRDDDAKAPAAQSTAPYDDDDAAVAAAAQLITTAPCEEHDAVDALLLLMEVGKDTASGGIPVAMLLS